MRLLVLCTSSRGCKMWSVVAREVNFGMKVAFTISAEQRGIETVVCADISHSDICLNTSHAPDLLRFAALR